MHDESTCLYDKKTTKMSTLQKVFVLIFSIILLFFFLVLILVLVVFPKLSSPSCATTHFTYLKFNPSTKKKSHGELELQGSRSEKFISYQEPKSRSHVLITPFGSPNEEYECAGKCVCDDQERRSVGVLSRGLIYLVSALSSTYAVHLSQRHFDQTCYNQHHSSCDTIRSEIEGCVNAVEYEDYDIFEEDVEKGYADLQKRTIAKFRCRGRCIKLDQFVLLKSLRKVNEITKEAWNIFKDNSYLIKKVEERTNCEEIVLEEVIDNDKTTEFYRDSHIPMQIINARNMFMDMHLHPYCMIQGKRQVEFPIHLPDYQRTSMFHFCSGFHSDETNDSVDCEPIFDGQE